MTDHRDRFHQRHQLTDRDLLILLLDHQFHMEQQIMAGLAEVQTALSGLSAQVAQVSAEVAAAFAATAPVDLQPAVDQIAAISAQVAAIPTHP